MEWLEIFGHFFKTEEENKEREKLEKKKIKDRMIENRIIRDIRTHFEQEDDDYYQLKRVSNFWNNIHIACESNGDRNKKLLLEEYFNKIKPYLRDIIIGLQESDTWKIHLAIAIDFIPSKDTGKECVMHSKSNTV